MLNRNFWLSFFARWPIYSLYVTLSVLLPNPASGELSVDQLTKLVDVVKQVDAGGKGHPAAKNAVAALQDAVSADIPSLLAGMNGANPLAANWLQNVVENAASVSEGLPLEEIKRFLLDRSNDSQPRRLAYELLLQHDLETTKLLPGMLDDPSLDLRWMAVEQCVSTSESAADDAAKKDILKKALNSSRDTEQVDRIIAALGKLGEKILLVDHYAFLSKWKLVGPFDNVGQKGFDVSYPPETDIAAAKYPGKNGDVEWKEYVCTADDGVTKLTEIYGPEKGAIVYALTELDSEKEQPAEVRVGCINACKAWFNGEPIMSHEKYHQAMMVDQYTAPVTLRAGKNTILLKICQNEQKEPWAQDWMFQVRVTTPDGIAIKNSATK